MTDQDGLRCSKLAISSMKHSCSIFALHRGAFASFLFGAFTTMAVINLPERKLENAPLDIANQPIINQNLTVQKLRRIFLNLNVDKH